MGQIGIMYHFITVVLNWMHREDRSFTSVIFLPKPESNHEATSDKLKLKDILQHN